MNNAITKEKLEEILNSALKDVTEQTAGVRLHEEDEPLGEDLCTVNITFDKGFETGLTLCADTALLTRMARNTFHEEDVSSQDLEDFSKEYFNVLCGKIVSAVYKVCGIPAHFGTPNFYRGRYEPEGQTTQFVLTYSDDLNEHAQLIHHIPEKGEARQPGND